MRTTVTLDPDVEQLLRDATRGSGLSFKKAINDGLRRGLAHLAPATAVTPFVVKARPLGLRVGVDPAQLHDLADDLDADAFCRHHSPAPEEIEIVIIPDANLHDHVAKPADPRLLQRIQQ